MFARISTSLLMLTLASTATAQISHVRNGIPVSHNLPPAQMLLEPGEGVGGPGPGVLSAAGYASTVGSGAIDSAAAACGPFGAVVHQNVQVLFDEPESMVVYWDVSGIGQYDSAPNVVPFRQNFGQAGVYRLKLTDISGRLPGLELYPTIEIGSVTSRTAAYLAHSAVPIRFTQEDFDQVTAGNFVTKVIYVPDPEFQELALAGVDVLVSTRLDPGVDPIVEADRRGAILAILRVGNKDLEMPGTNSALMAGAMPATGVVGRAGGGGTGSSDYISGVSGPSYGMPWTGTQIGLPGPPHIPLGGPAGLQNYTIHNHTAMQIPGPTPKVNVHVKQKPGLTYPRPADKVFIREKTIRPPHFNGQPPADMVHGQLPYKKRPLQKILR